nr:RNA-dependent RNA polymerase [Durnavirales sp.]
MWDPHTYALFLIALRYCFMRYFTPIKKSFIIHWCDLFYLPWRWAKSSGWPYCVDRKTRSKGTAWNKFTEYGRNVAHGIKHMTLNPMSCTLPLKNYIIMGYNRFHIARAGDFAKIRLVFGVPMILLAFEHMLFSGYLFMIKRFGSSPIAYGKEIYRGGMTYVNSHITNGDIIICDDISGFDYHVYFWFIQLIFRIIFKNFISFKRYWPCFKEGGKYFTTLMNPIVMMKQYFNVLIITIRWICEWKVLLPTREFLFRRFQFLPSGILMTNFLDSTINTIITYHVCLCVGLRVDEITFIIVLGDDLTFTIPQAALNRLRISANGFYRQFDSIRKDLYNMSSGGKPRYVGRDKNKLVFLKYRNEYGRPIRDLEELTAGALIRERHLKPEYLASVLVGLAYAATATSRAYHECLRDAYDFCIKAGNDKGVKQSIATDDRYVSELCEEIGLSDEELMTFPSYEEVYERVTCYRRPDTSKPYHNFNHEAFAYPNSGHAVLFDPIDADLDICEEFISTIR